MIAILLKPCTDFYLIVLFFIEITTSLFICRRFFRLWTLNSATWWEPFSVLFTNEVLFWYLFSIWPCEVGDFSIFASQSAFSWRAISVHFILTNWSFQIDFELFDVKCSSNKPKATSSQHLKTKLIWYFVKTSGLHFIVTGSDWTWAVTVFSFVSETTKYSGYAITLI